MSMILLSFQNEWEQLALMPRFLLTHMWTLLNIRIRVNTLQGIVVLPLSFPEVHSRCIWYAVCMCKYLGSCFLETAASVPIKVMLQQGCCKDQGTGSDSSVLKHCHAVSGYDMTAG